jgi:antitoxin component YwqK of YwqJK toxin-antitoxin module
MSKKIHTIQSTDKKKFDEQVNTLLEIGCELLENTYKVIENDDGVIYSQVVEYDSTNTYIILYNHGQIKLTRGLKDGKFHGLVTWWYENGQKSHGENYKDGIKDGLVTWWYENGQKKKEVNFKDGKEDGSFNEWFNNGQKKTEGTYKDGEGIGKWIEYFGNGSIYSEKEYGDLLRMGRFTWDLLEEMDEKRKNN